jgi:hypothetical protein
MDLWVLRFAEFGDWGWGSEFKGVGIGVLELGIKVHTYGIRILG